jgi:hypothetical protein
VGEVLLCRLSAGSRLSRAVHQRSTDIWGTGVLRGPTLINQDMGWFYYCPEVFKIVKSFLDPRLIDEVSAMYSSLTRLQENTPAELVLRQGEFTSIYDCHPWLFYEAFPGVREEDVRTLSLAVRLFASSLMATNTLFSATASSAGRTLAQMRLRTWQDQARLCLHQIFPPDAKFWIELSDLLAAVAQAVGDEQRFISGDAEWRSYREFAYDIATKENGIGQISIFGLAELSQTSAPAELLQSLNNVSFAVRMLADLKSWRQQLQNGIPSLLLSEMLDHAPPLHDHAAMSLLTEQIEGRMRSGSSVRRVMQEALRALDQAEEALHSIPDHGWRREI